MLSDPVRQKAYQPFGDLRFTFAHDGEVTNYHRELDLTTAVATTRYTVGGVAFTREFFASYPDNVMVMRICSDMPGQVSFGVTLDSPHRSSRTNTTFEGDLVLTGQVHDPVALKLLRQKNPALTEDALPPETMGMNFQSVLRLFPSGGTVQTNSSSINIAQADSVVLLLVAATNFVNFQCIDGNAAANCAQHLQSLKGKSYSREAAPSPAGSARASPLAPLSKLNRKHREAAPSPAGSARASPLPSSGHDALETGQQSSVFHPEFEQ